MELIYRTDAAFVRQVQQEMYSQKTKRDLKTVALPCGHGNLQVGAPSDDMIALQCPTCHKTHYLIWSSLGSHKWKR